MKKILCILAVLTPFVCESLSAEMREFTNQSDQKIRAEIVAVKSGKVTLRMKNSIKNKDLPKASHFQLNFSKKQKRVKLSEGGKKKGQTRITEQTDVTYRFKLGSRSAQSIENVTVRYFILKLTASRGDESPDKVIECVGGEERFSALGPKETKEWVAKEVPCMKSTTSVTIENRKTKGEYVSKDRVVGAMVVVFIGSNELFRKSDSISAEKEFTKYFKDYPEKLKLPSTQH